VKVRRTLRHGKTVWELDTGVIEGKRRRLFFRTEKAARLRMSEIEADFQAAGRRWTAASAASKANVIRILDEIQSQGLTLERVWHAYRSGKVAFEDSGKRLADAIEEVLEAKTAANRRPVYLTELRRYLRLFARGRESMDVGTFGVTDIEAWFSERKEPPSSRAGNLGKLSALFDHCWRRGYIKENPVSESRSRTSRLVSRRSWPSISANASSGRRRQPTDVCYPNLPWDCSLVSGPTRSPGSTGEESISNEAC